MPDAPYTIRELCEDDAEAFRALRMRGLRDEPTAFGASHEDFIAKPMGEHAERLRHAAGDEGQAILGAFADGASGISDARGIAAGMLVGMGGVVRSAYPKERHWAMIWGIYVAPEARGTGLGRALMAELIARARAMPGVEQLRLGVNTRNAPAVALYRAMGFAEYGTEPHALKVGDTYVDEYLMLLRLTE